MTLRTGGGGGFPLGGSFSPAICSHLTAVLGFSTLVRGEARMSIMYIIFQSFRLHPMMNTTIAQVMSSMP